VADLDARIKQLDQEKETLARNEQQTISLLVSEKASLTSELEGLIGAASRKLSFSLTTTLVSRAHSFNQVHKSWKDSSVKNKNAPKTF